MTRSKAHLNMMIAFQELVTLLQLRINNMKTLKIFTITTLTALFPLIVSAQVQLTNPLGTSDPREIIARIIQGALGVSGSLTFLMIVYGGFLWLTSAGQTAQIDKGKKVLTWAVIGFAVIASAYVITTAVINALLTGNVA